MRIFAEEHYVPILKGRAAEYDALAALDEGQRGALTPVIELMPVPWDFVNQQPAVTVRDHVAAAVRNIKNSWGDERRLFVDLMHVDSSATTDEGQQPLAFLLEQANEQGLRIVPVLGLERPDRYIQSAKVGHAGRGVCLRLLSGELARSGVAQAIDELIAQLGLLPSGVDILIDLRELNAESVDFNIIGAIGVLMMVPRADEWRSVTLAGSTFPADLSGVSPASEETFPRAEWVMWKALTARSAQLPLIPTFGDYAIEHPDPRPGLDPRILRISAQLRYTTDDAWLVFKERNIRDFGSEQFIDICRRLVRRPEFRGADFSWGDSYIAERANGRDARPGNPRVWRKVGTNHHMAAVIDQIARLAA